MKLLENRFIVINFSNFFKGQFEKKNVSVDFKMKADGKMES